MKLLITGAYGFVGTNLCRYLTVRGHVCHALDITSRADVPYAQSFTWENPPVDFTVYDAVVHLAGKAHDLRRVVDPQAYFDVNVGLTERIFAQVAGKGPRFIYFSSSKAADADTPYAQSKRAAEKFLDGRAIVLRPAMIHGPGNKGNLNLLWNLARRGFPWPLAAFENQRSFTSVENVCAVVEALAARGENGVWPIADDETLSTNRIIELMAEACGRPARLWHLPRGLMTVCARIGDVLHLPLNTERLAKLTENSQVDNAALKAQLGWAAMPVRAEAGMRATLAGFRTSDEGNAT